MTKDEIKRALEMCADTCFRVCCPYGAAINCCGKLKRDAIDLITEQEKEIKKQNGRVKCLKTRLANKMVLLSNVEDLYESETQKLKEEKQELKTALKQSEDNYSRAFERLKAQKREIERLKAENEKRLTCDFVKTAQKQAQIDVLNELRERITKDRVANDTVVINVNYEIKELIKEVEAK